MYTLRHALLWLAAPLAVTAGAYGQATPAGAPAASTVQGAPAAGTEGGIVRGRTAVPAGALRFIHIAPDADPVSFVVDDTFMPTLSFRDASDVQYSIPSGTLTVNLTKPDGGPTLFTRDVTVSPDTVVGAFLVGRKSDDSYSLTTLQTPLTMTVPAGTSLVRLFHAAPEMGAVNVVIQPQTGSPITWDNISYLGSSTFLPVPSGAVSITVTPVGGGAPLMTLSGFLPADRIMTAIATGLTSNNSLGINDLFEDLGAQTPMAFLPAEVSRVIAADGADAHRGMTFRPNPATDQATISLHLAADQDLSMRLYDPLGRLAAELPLGHQPAGDRALPISLPTLPAGIYQSVITGSNGAMIATDRVAIAR